MPKCEQCNREFTTEEGYNQHMRDKHGVGRQTTHDAKQVRREEREKQGVEISKKQKSGKRMKQAAMIVGGFVAIAAVAYAVITFMPSTGGGARYDLSGIPNSFVHWHADVNVNICGEDRKLPEASVGGLLGTARMHTHDYSQNIASLPGTDGNGILHTEGIIPQAPAEHTLSKFMSNIGVKFGNNTVMEKTDGDMCNDTPGSMKITLNGAPLNDFMNYLPKDHDVINIEFS